MAYAKHRGLTRIIRAFGYSWNGLRAAFRHEEAFRQELMLLVVLVPAVFWLTAEGVERALLLGSILLIVIIELVNSAIEAVVDRLGTEFHELSARAKDIGSAAVLLSFCNALVIWILVLFF